MNVQRFKMNIANEVVTQQNGGLQTMDTDQLLDLFEVGDVKEKRVVQGSGKNAVLAELGELYDDDHYNEDVNAYMKKMDVD